MILILIVNPDLELEFGSVAFAFSSNVVKLKQT